MTFLAQLVDSRRIDRQLRGRCSRQEPWFRYFLCKF